MRAQVEKGYRDLLTKRAPGVSEDEPLAVVAEVYGHRKVDGDHLAADKSAKGGEIEYGIVVAFDGGAGEVMFISPGFDANLMKWDSERLRQLIEAGGRPIGILRTLTGFSSRITAGEFATRIAGMLNQPLAYQVPHIGTGEARHLLATVLNRFAGDQEVVRSLPGCLQNAAAPRGN